MPAPLAAAVVAAIARAAVSNAAKKRLMQAAAKKVSEKDIKSLIRTEMKTGAMDLGKANRIPGPKNPPKRVVSRQGTGSVRAPKVDPAKELYNLYKPQKPKPDTKTVTKSMQKERVTPADVVTKRIEASKAKPRVGRDTSAKAAKEQKPAKKILTQEARIKAKGSAVRSKRKGPTNVETDEPQGVTIRGKFYPDGNTGLMPRSGSNPTITSREKAPSTDVPEKPTRFSREADRIASEAVRKTNILEAFKKAQLEAAVKASKVKSSPDKAKAIAEAKAAARRVEALAKKAGPDAKPVPRRTIEEAIRNARQRRSGTTPAQKARAQRTEIAKGKLTQAQLNEIKKIAARIKKAGQ
jgi:hypothetical protein